MCSNRITYLIAITLITFTAGINQVIAAEYLNREIEIRGQWANGRIHASKLETPNIRRDKTKGRISGRITGLSRQQRRMKIGAVTLFWTDKTRFEGLSTRTLKRGSTVKVNVRLNAQGKLEATRIRPREPHREPIRLRGVVSTEEKLADRSRVVTILGLQAHIPRKVSKEVVRLIRRPDDRRPLDQFTMTIDGRPLTIGGEYNFETEDRHDFKLGAVDDDLARVKQELQLEFFYPFSDELSMFLEARGNYNRDVHREDDTQELETNDAVSRGETWLYIGRLFDKYSALQIGRQNIREKREWWWDEDLDAARLHYSKKDLYMSVGLARELLKVSSEDDDIDPEQEDVTRLLVHGVWQWRKRQLLEVFGLSQRDSSDVHIDQQIVKRDQRDQSDADLDWLGLRARGKVKFQRAGRLLYWLDTAVVKGNEDVFDYDATTPVNPRYVEFSLSGSDLDQDVEGWAYDIGVSWSTRLPGRPAFTLGYAVGSGDDDLSDNTDKSFHQTGLQDNNGRFHGVNRFRYYGELLRPELSNLRIATAAIGFPFWQKSSVELVYHRYQQVYQQPRLRDARVDFSIPPSLPNSGDFPNGQDKDIGQELDLVIGMRKWKHVDLELILAKFRAGKAYNIHEGKTARYANFEFTYNF